MIENDKKSIFHFFEKFNKKNNYKEKEKEKEKL